MLKFRVFIISALVFIMLPAISKADTQKKLVVVTVNTATAEELLENKFIKPIAENGVLGLMNTKSNGRNNQYKPYVTLGSGEKGEVYFDYLESVMVDEVNKSLYEDITLNKAVEGNIVNMSINLINRINLNTLYGAEPGKLGKILKSNGLSRCFIGGFWYNDSIKTPAFFMIMDDYGLVDCGDVDGVFVNGLFDYEKLLRAFNKYKNESDYIVIELGEIESFYGNKKYYSEKSYVLNKQNILDRCGQAIDLIKKNIDFQNTVLCIMAPYSWEKDKNGEVLSPIILYDGGKTRGVLTSDTTRSIGIVSSLDFAPYVLEFYGIEQKGFTGYSVRCIELDNPSGYILDINRKVNVNSSWRTPVLKVYAIFIMLLLAIYFVGLFKYNSKSQGVIEYFMECCLIAPFVFLIEGWMSIESILIKLTFYALLDFSIVALLENSFKKGVDRIAAITFLNIALLVIDLFTGQKMLKNSILSYDPLIGARFYGIGNEYMGVMVGCLLIFCGCMTQKHTKLRTALVPFLSAACLLIGLPYYGSNVGGFITAAFGFSVFILLEHDYGIMESIKLCIWFSISMIVLFFMLNIIFRSSQSHLGRMLEMVGYGGTDYFVNIVLRKFNMAVKLIRYTIWSKVFIALIIAASIVIIKPHKYTMRFFEDAHHLKNSCIGAITGSIAAIISNDSGIVTAALIMLYAVYTMIILLPNNRVRLGSDEG